MRLDGTNAEEGRQDPGRGRRRRTSIPSRRCSTRRAARWSWRARDRRLERASASSTATSEAQREGADLDLIVEWAAGARTALDVATGGGHVARRLREAGLEVVSCDPAPGMRPDVICRAEDLPVRRRRLRRRRAPRRARTTSRTSRAAVGELARVAARPRARRRQPLPRRARARRPSACATRRTSATTPRTEWRGFFGAAGLAVEEVRALRQADRARAVARARRAATGEEAERVRELLARPDRGRPGRARPDRAQGRGRR